MKATQEQIQEWKKKHHSVFALESDEKTCYIFSPIENLSILKAFMNGLAKGSFECVDVLITNCWLGGDEEMKTDDRIKMSLVDQVRDFVEFPDHEVEFDDNSKTATITVEGKPCKVRLATRQDIRYAEDRNKAGKPLDTQMYLLERIAIDDLADWRKDVPAYVSLLTAMDKVKDRTVVSLKKL